MSERDLRIDVPGAGAVTAIETPAEGKSAGWTFVYAPGAGSSVHDPFGSFACRELASRGVRCVRFQFPYQEAKRKSPDKNDLLEATWRAVIDEVRDDNRLVIGGRSMGGRIGSQVVAQDSNADTIALFAYPLHPPGRPEKSRTAHLPAVQAPTLFCSGTGDAFGSPEELAEAAALVPKSTLHLLDGADHGFAVRKASGRTKDDVWREAVDTMWEWLAAL
ncbi:MAG: alpha/beta family hydrolase [Chloroflexota bacterium]